MPFWFWNDGLTREELIRQLHEFHAKEVDGFVLHPRMGLPRTLPYLSEPFMALVETAVSEAAKLGMTVILYDEAMYPSGSACGMVVRQNPDYASRGLQLREFPYRKGESPAFPLIEEESLVSLQAMRVGRDGSLEPESAIVLPHGEDGLPIVLPDESDWRLLAFVETPSRGTIRGVHEGQDDGEADAPPSADLLNPSAVQAFITLTHDVYYAKLAPYFGTTVIAMFTDEPDLLGRNHRTGLMPWTRGFLEEYIAAGGEERELPLLWLEGGERVVESRAIYDAAIRSRMTRTYYKPLADWCESHGIGLTGHPAESDDMGLLRSFHIPGQDVVWRYIAPENEKGITGVHSTMGKCSSDSARHRGKRRNLNEAFGVCGSEGGWSLTADNMKWYLDWLFVRGVNMICPHAFYYSIRGARRDERPPDVGPNNIWWPEYAMFSRYIKRLSWLMTDSMNGAKVAVMGGEAHLPWRIVRPLYESQIEFNYLEESLLADSCELRDGAIHIAGYRYEAVMVEEGWRLSPASWRILQIFAQQGGCLIELTSKVASKTGAGLLRTERETDIPQLLTDCLAMDYRLEPAAPSIRISTVAKGGVLFYVIVNEGEDSYRGKLEMNQGGYAEWWNPWSGECGAAACELSGSGMAAAFQVERRECLIMAIDNNRTPGVKVSRQTESGKTLDLSEGWRVIEGPWTGELAKLSSWTEWKGLAHYSGEMVYEMEFSIDAMSPASSWRLDLGDIHEIARLQVNGKEAGVAMWKPYVFHIGPLVQPGANKLRLSVQNSLANQYDGKSFPSGLIGPVRLS
jgi:hypothetical protein